MSRQIPLDQIEPNRWNPNEVAGETYVQLVKDMQEHGQREPVTVSPYPVFYPNEDRDPEHPYTTPEAWTGFFVICDGEHRLRAAKSLGWETIDAVVMELTEDEALTAFYRNQSTRGSFDPFKEALLFQRYLDRGLTQEVVVETLNLSSVGYLTDRLYLLQLSPDVREMLDRLPEVIEMEVRERSRGEGEEEIQLLVDEIFARAKFTTRHLRPLATLQPRQQKTVLDEMIEIYVEGGTFSVRAVEARVKTIKEIAAQRQRFMKAWETAKVKDCPTCSNPAVGFDPHDENELTFRCAKGHTWRYDKTYEELEEERKEKLRRELEERRAAEALVIESVLAKYSWPPTREKLLDDYYLESTYMFKGDAEKAVNAYLEAHPDLELAEPPETPEPRETPPAKPYATPPEAVTNHERLLEKGMTEEAEEYAEAMGIKAQLGLGKPEEPRFLRFATTAATPNDLHDAAMDYILDKILPELTGLTSIELRGWRGGEPVSLRFRDVMWYSHRDLGGMMYRVGDRDLGYLIQDEEYENVTVVAPFDTSGPDDELQAKKQLIARFFGEIVGTKLDPWPPLEEATDAAEDAEDPDEPELGDEPEEDAAGVIECPGCGKTVPWSLRCINCGEELPAQPRPEEPTIPVPDHGRGYQEDEA